MTLHGSPASREFDVAVSFVGEDRGLVEAVVIQLQRSGVRVFYDDDQTAAMWGADLIEYFDQVYRQRSRYVVIFISRYYAAKMWPRHERRSALARGLELSEPYVLPVRLDDTPSTAGDRLSATWMRGTSGPPASWRPFWPSCPGRSSLDHSSR